MKYKIILVLSLLAILFLFEERKDFSQNNAVQNYANIASITDDEGADRMGRTTFSQGTPNNTKAGTSAKGVAIYTSRWLRYIDGKMDVLYNQKYTAGTPIVYQLSDYEKITKNGFFQGWFGPANTVPGGGWYKADRVAFTLFGNTDITTKYQNCAELSPKHVFFKSVNALEKKLVQFANNVGDSKLGIKAKGEVNALAVMYSDGGVCVQFTEGCTGGVSCSPQSIEGFLNAYKGKSITQVLDYHTHDLNTGKEISKTNFKWLLTYDNGKYFTTIPSDLDLYTSYQQKGKGFAKILGTADIIEKVISANGVGFTYDAPITKKANENFASWNKFSVYSGEVVQKAQSLLNESLKKNNRKQATNEDSYFVQASLITYYQNSLGATFKYFTVQ